ncbi:wax ester/triacylglycerol synthase family O-acyltransferase [[Mycobacterium] kokjensenii]|uniref:Diacylglycerol O-acyltransferase n=1 Tax=[Mycobacterium] kokjensenii TaxID=3064287 RepID=A0ABM9LJM3_9MYCO|nr:wax ester/triacylglycerol synthase family O-acyltransferase [Mycolicibacter sp. MU0083]CAJ1500047.1 wax ester/triacylglycerol synthase family O-acyltransferase [Mycolicibacter sp. MU0083]
MAEHLTPLDAGFLGVEDSDHNVSMAIGTLAVLDGPMPDHDAIQATLADRLRGCPRFGQRLVRHALGLGTPEWVDDPHFDIAHHIGRIAVPAPGGDAELHGVIADVMSWRLDRRRPLWEIWVIGGLADDRWALLMKVHQCIADAGATAHMLTGLSDNGFGDAAVAAPRDAARPPHHRPVPDLNPLHWIDNLRGVVELATGLLQPAESPLNGPITSRRRYSAARVALADVEQICRAFDVTVNDVVLAALTESYRDFMIRRGQVPQPDSLRTLVPVATAGEEARQAQNRVSLLLPNLPIEESHPVRRLLAVRSRLAHAKAGGQHHAGHAVMSAAGLLPVTWSGWAAQLLGRLHQRGVVTVATTVPGPAVPLQIMGCDVVQVLPVPPIAMQLRTGVAILGYAGNLFVGMLADFDLAAADELTRGLETAVGRLVARSKRRRPLRDWHGLGLVHSA